MQLFVHNKHLLICPVFVKFDLDFKTLSMNQISNLKQEQR